LHAFDASLPWHIHCGHFTNYPAAIFDLAAILEIRIFCDASISNIDQHILKYIQTKFHAFTMKCTMISMIRCTKLILDVEPKNLGPLVAAILDSNMAS